MHVQQQQQQKQQLKLQGTVDGILWKFANGNRHLIFSDAEVCDTYVPRSMCRRRKQFLVFKTIKHCVAEREREREFQVRK